MAFIDGRSVLVTGGTGSFGRRFVETVLRRHRPKRLVVFSRDEVKQLEMQQRFPAEEHRCLRYFLGDVRDRDRLYRAFAGIDVVVHAAALKQVPAAEHNPLESVKTNVLGAANVIDAAVDRGVSRVVALSTDKAADPVNLYGATKLCADKLFVAANHCAGAREARFSVVRYGNVVGSRGGVIPLFLRLRETGVLPVTDPRMTRFWITLEDAVDFVLDRLEAMQGGEVFVPKVPSMRVMDLAAALAPECETKIVGMRPGEKLHEVMVPEGVAHHTLDCDRYYAILPAVKHRDRDAVVGSWCPSGFSYRSDTNEHWLTAGEMRALAAALAAS